MSLTPENIAEIDLLLLFNLSSSQAGIKIHHTAQDEAVTAANRLFEKGFITQTDGGYLTNLGLGAAEHAQALFTLLSASSHD